jgi:hypothetical protein
LLSERRTMCSALRQPNVSHERGRARIQIQPT